MKVAVIVAAYNAAPYVEDALASLLRQRDAAQFDIIVVNDGSTDGTGDVVRKVAAEASEVRLIETPNRGIAAARNRALDAVAPDVDLLTVLDADDLSPAGRFARDVAHFAADPALEFLYGHMRVFRDLSADRMTPDPEGRFVDVRGIQLGAALMRRSLSAAVGRFDERLVQGEDTDFLLRLVELQPKTILTDDLCVYYRRHDGNITRDRAVAIRYFHRAVLEHARRQRAGAAPIPRGFFDGSKAVLGLDWW